MSCDRNFEQQMLLIVYMSWLNLYNECMVFENALLVLLHNDLYEGCNSSRWFSEIYTTWTTRSRHNTNQVIGTNIQLIRVVSVGRTFWLLVPCMRKVHTRPALLWSKQLSRSRLVSCELFSTIFMYGCNRLMPTASEDKTS